MPNSPVSTVPPARSIANRLAKIRRLWPFAIATGAGCVRAPVASISPRSRERRFRPRAASRRTSGQQAQVIFQLALPLRGRIFVHGLLGGLFKPLTDDLLDGARFGGEFGETQQMHSGDVSASQPETEPRYFFPQRAAVLPHLNLQPAGRLPAILATLRPFSHASVNGRGALKIEGLAGSFALTLKLRRARTTVRCQKSDHSCTSAS